ncbi:SCO family protein [Thiocapsa bogorovii]|uniref:SCO family protein n=1 Tax=Thiocapsa bogorovii TaxID=521689 RepID=UPI001E3141DB|nr:SCO family protein [Thiocapsa bogorovii]UHD18731.1 SCO family protein [Thiocapsa bogorovii]
MTRKLLIIVILILVGLLAWLSFWSPTEVGIDPEAPQHNALDLASPPQGGDFVLDSVNGPVALADLRGKVVLIYFGYTWCPDICPTNLVLIAGALKALTPEELERVRVLFISVDPERDSATRLAEYSGYFHPEILGLTGTSEQIAEVAKLYGAAYRRTDLDDSAMGYVVDHSAYTHVVDTQGKLVLNLDHATPSTDIVAAIRNLLGSSPSTENQSKP